MWSEKDEKRCPDNDSCHFTLNFEILRHHHKPGSAERTVMISFTSSGNIVCLAAVVNFSEIC